MTSQCSKASTPPLLPPPLLPEEQIGASREFPLPCRDLAEAGNGQGGLQAGLSTSAQKCTKFSWECNAQGSPGHQHTHRGHRATLGSLAGTRTAGTGPSLGCGAGSGLLHTHRRNQIPEGNPQPSISWELRNAGSGTKDKSFPFHAK